MSRNRRPSSLAEMIDRCAEVLLQARGDGQRLEGLPADISPRTRTDAYTVQARVAELEEQATIGWKIAATSPAGQRHINVDAPLGGRVLSGHTYLSASVVSLEGNAMCLAEPEFVFVLGSAIPPRTRAYTTEEIFKSVSELRFGIELPSTRFTDVTTVGANQLIADNACAHQFVMGPDANSAWAEMDLSSVTMQASIDSPAHSRSVSGSGANVLGDPRAALTWLVNELHSINATLEAGSIVTTGTCSTPIPVEPGDRLEAHFNNLGTVTATFVL